MLSISRNRYIQFDISHGSFAIWLQINNLDGPLWRFWALAKHSSSSLYRIQCFRMPLFSLFFTTRSNRALLLLQEGQLGLLLKTLDSQLSYTQLQVHSHAMFWNFRINSNLNVTESDISSRWSKPGLCRRKRPPFCFSSFRHPSKQLTETLCM